MVNKWQINLRRFHLSHYKTLVFNLKHLHEALSYIGGDQTKVKVEAVPLLNRMSGECNI